VPRPWQAIRSRLRRRGLPADREAAAREAFWLRAGSITPYVAAEHHGIAYILPTAIGPKWFLDGGRAEFVVLERACAVLRGQGRLSGEDTIVDIGAHIGTTSIAALTNHGFTRAVAVEPDPAHLPLLRANVALNGLHDRVQVVAAAMSDRRGHERPFLQGSRKGDSYRWMKGRLVEESPPEAVAVETVALDELAAQGIIEPARTGLLWFDCSSCEHEALQAAETFLQRNTPLVFTVRRHQFAKPTPLLERLRDIYEHAVDLRSPSLAEPVSRWSPTFRQIDDLRLIPEDKKVTDVLVF
jgi:FkbM family methyltransferase